MKFITEVYDLFHQLWPSENCSLYYCRASSALGGASASTRFHQLASVIWWNILIKYCIKWLYAYFIVLSSQHEYYWLNVILRSADKHKSNHEYAKEEEIRKYFSRSSIKGHVTHSRNLKQGLDGATQITTFSIQFSWVTASISSS